MARLDLLVLRRCSSRRWQLATETGGGAAGEIGGGERRQQAAANDGWSAVLGTALWQRLASPALSPPCGYTGRVTLSGKRWLTSLGDGSATIEGDAGTGELIFLAAAALATSKEGGRTCNQKTEAAPGETLLVKFLSFNGLQVAAW